MADPKIAFVAGKSDTAQDAMSRLCGMYDHVTPDKADVIVALGGDGYMLRTLHKYLHLNKPVFGMNRGSVGFLMNEYREDDLMERISRMESFEIHPLRMEAQCKGGKIHEAIAFNEVSLFRETGQAAHIRVSVDGVVRLDEMVCDGLLISTPAGSTAYNMSAYGPILPLGAGVLALTAISAYRPRRWRGAILPHSASVNFEIINDEKRPVGVSADFNEFRDVLNVKVYEDRSLYSMVLYDPEHNLEERILQEQFMG
ncbi:putative inorganic polyphosphate/ATP-NAD kinase [Candidatus Terasakiella magnetica]|uniref:NAD kinase n=1 Tax=Candidatus Terasakiella magnetica TaxID=1867952 RepID=A0A1C3RHQ7_9PROT|nr:NAD kinase [Candidatus Terasakiella magnetica]SCA56811.1 putative inorganic polyphosphate/ATP-NAD kinase [Candidatus Terasakiella magnetica]